MGNRWQFMSISIGILVSMTLLLAENSTQSEKFNNELTQQQTLQTMNETLTDQDIRVNTFDIYARNHQEHFVSYDEVTNYLKNWKQSNDRVRWTFQDTNDQKKWVGTFTDRDKPLTETLSVYVIPGTTEDDYVAYTIYEVSFQPFPQWETTLTELFHSTSTLVKFDDSDVFLRVEGTVEGDDESNVQQWGQSIISSFSAEVVEKLEEETFVSLSAHTPLWGQEIKSNDQEMNMQLALRTNSNGLGGETTVTIGTPLITTEY